METIQVNQMTFLLLGLFAVIALLALMIFFFDKWINSEAFINFVDFQGNEFMSNVDRDDLIMSLDDSFFKNEIDLIEVTYNDGIKKDFDSFSWRLHGKEIMRNCKKIKVIINWKK